VVSVILRSELFPATASAMESLDAQLVPLAVPIFEVGLEIVWPRTRVRHNAQVVQCKRCVDRLELTKTSFNKALLQITQ